MRQTHEGNTYPLSGSTLVDAVVRILLYDYALIDVIIPGDSRRTKVCGKTRHVC